MGMVERMSKIEEGDLIEFTNSVVDLVIARFMRPGDAIADAGALVGAERYLRQPEVSTNELELRPASPMRIPMQGHPPCDPKRVYERLQLCAPLFVVDGFPWRGPSPCASATTDRQLIEPRHRRMRTLQRLGDTDSPHRGMLSHHSRQAGPRGNQAGIEARSAVFSLMLGVPTARGRKRIFAEALV